MGVGIIRPTQIWNLSQVMKISTSFSIIAALSSSVHAYRFVSTAKSKQLVLHRPLTSSRCKMSDGVSEQFASGIDTAVDSQENTPVVEKPEKMTALEAGMVNSNVHKYSKLSA